MYKIIIAITVSLSTNKSTSFINDKTMKGLYRNRNIDSSTNIKSSNNSFYERLGKPKYITAPMVSQSDLAFRLLTKQYGSELCYTQMIHANNFQRCADFRKNSLDVYLPGTVVQALPSQLDALGMDFDDEYYIEYNEDEEGAVMIQLAGNDGSVMKEAALRVLEQMDNGDKVAGIDINLGCPQGIARKGNYGAHLFTYDEHGTQVCDILSSLNDALPSHIGLSAKIRLLPDLQQLPNRIQMMLDAARLDLLTIHGRTIKENKTATKHPNWDAIAHITQSFPNIPIVANGGIEYASDITRCLSHTNAKAVMSSEALLENPGLFSNQDDTNLLPRQILHRQVEYALSYLNLTLKYPPLPVGLGKYGGCFAVIRSHLFKILYRYLEEQIDLRSALADSDVTHTIPQAISLVHTLLERYENVSDDELLLYKSSNLKSSWYRRHRRYLDQRNNLLNKKDCVSLSIDERKDLIRNRINKLKVMKEQKQSINSFV